MNKITFKILKILNGLTIKQATFQLLSALRHVAADADSEEVRNVMSKMLIEQARELDYKQHKITQ